MTASAKIVNIRSSVNLDTLGAARLVILISVGILLERESKSMKESRALKLKNASSTLR